MADQDTLNRKPKKFLFDANNFDEPDTVEPEIPPPPMFSEAELDAARLLAFEKGRVAGLAEAEASREKLVSGLVQTITDNFQQLFEAEKSRAGQFEGEVLLVTRAIFEKLFPALNEANGLAEVEAAVAQVLENQRGLREIVIEAHSDFTMDIQALATEVMKLIHGAGTVTVIPNDQLARGDCRMSWNDGGAERSATHLASEIRKTLDEALGTRPVLQDNREESAPDDAQGDPR